MGARVGPPVPTDRARFTREVAALIMAEVIGARLSQFTLDLNSKEGDKLVDECARFSVFATKRFLQHCRANEDS